MKTEREQCYFPKCSWWDNPTREIKLSVKDKTQEEIGDVVDKDELYELDK